MDGCIWVQVSVPAFNSLLSATATATVVTVRCGHCANLLSVNIGAASLQYYSLPSPNPSPTTGTAHPHAQHYHSHPNLHTLQVISLTHWFNYLN